MGRILFDLIKPELDAYLFDPLSYIYLLPRGIWPERQSAEAVGYDVHLRALVAKKKGDKDPTNPAFRRTIFDFLTAPDDPKVAGRIEEVKKPGGEGYELAYRMRKGESILVGIGFATAMQFRQFFWIAPRSGLATEWGITVTNAPGTVDPDYRGEAGVLVYNRENKYFDILYGMRVSQIIFGWALTPVLRQVLEHCMLPATERGGGGFGSTGIYLDEKGEKG